MLVVFLWIYCEICGIIVTILYDLRLRICRVFKGLRFYGDKTVPDSMLYLIILFAGSILLQAMMFWEVRSTSPNFCKAVNSFPVPCGLDDWDFYGKKFLMCGMQDSPGRLPQRYEFKGTTKGVLIQEYTFGCYFLKRRAIFVPWNALSEPRSIKLPWYLSFWLSWNMMRKYSTFFEVNGTSMLLVVRNKYLDRSGFNSHCALCKDSSDNNIE